MKPRRLHSATTLSMVTTSVGTRPGSLCGCLLGTVVPCERVAIGRVRDEPGGDEHGLAEDRRARVDEQVGAVDVVDHVLDAAHAAVDRLDGHAVQVGAVVTHVLAEVPQVGHGSFIPRIAPRRAPILGAAMPIYEFRCENGHLFEVMQKITDPPVTECETCGAPVTRVFHPIAVHFKGSG